MVHDLAVVVVVDELAEVVDGAVPVLGEEVECLLDKLTVREGLLLEHQHLDSRDLAALAQDHGLQSRVDDLSGVRIGVLTLEDLGSEAREWEQRVRDVRREVGGVEVSRRCTVIARQADRRRHDNSGYRESHGRCQRKQEVDACSVCHCLLLLRGCDCFPAPPFSPAYL